MDKLSDYKIQRLNFALFVLVLSSITQGIGLSHLGYILTTLSFVAFLPFFRIKNLWEFNPSMRRIVIFITLYNIFLFIQMFITPTRQTISTIFLSPTFLQALLVFCFLLFDVRCLPYIIKQVPKLFVVIIMFAFINIEAILVLTVTFSFFLFVFGNIIQPNKIKLHVMWTVLFLLGVYMFILGYRFHFLAIALLASLHIVTLFLLKFNKIIWAGIVLLPFIFTISLFVFDTSVLNAKTYSDDVDDEYLSDSRTFLYIETIDYLAQENKMWTGVGVLGGISSDLLLSYDDSIAGDGKRQFVETNSLELMRRGGLVYLLLYLALFGIASYLSLKVSNKYVQKMGLLLSTVFLFSLIDIPIFMEPITICYFTIVSFVLNDQIKQISEEEFVYWIKRDNHDS